jgi:hypothetical protein
MTTERFVVGNALRRACDRLSNRRLRGGEPRDRHAEGRAGDIVQSDFVTEGDRGRIAPVLSANAKLEFGACLAPAFGRDPNEFADAIAVD